MATLRVGIAGTGAMAAWHRRSVEAVRGARVVACFDVDRQRAEAFARAGAVPVVAASLDELNEACDAIAVVTPDRFHAEMSVAVLEAGRHLLCEKPLTVTLAEARRVLRAYERARERGVVGMVNFSHRTGADFVEAARLVREGAIGSLRFARIHYLQGWLGDRGEGWKRPTSLWRLQRAAGSAGVLGDLGCHILDYVTAITGAPRRLHCTLRTHAKPTADGGVTRAFRGRLDANDTAMIQLDLGEDAYASAETTRWATGNDNRFELEVHGTDGGIRCGHGDSAVYVRVLDGGGQWREVHQRKRYPDNWQTFVRSIREGREGVPDIRRGAEVQALLDACECSAASGEWIRPRRLA